MLRKTNSTVILESLNLQRKSRVLTEAEPNEPVNVNTTPDMQVYMNTWANYNEYGADLSRYGIKDGWLSIDDAIDFCEKYADDEPFINDFENTPWELSEHDNAPAELQKIKDFCDNYDENDRKMIINIAEAYNGGGEPSSDDIEEAIRIFDDRAYTFIPDVDNDYDLGYYIIDEYGMEGINNPDYYFDSESWISDFLMEFDDTDEREAFARDKGIDVDDIDEDEFDDYMHDYAQEICDEMMSDRGTSSEAITNYFDYEALGRDLGYDGYTFTSDGAIRLD